MALAIRLRQHGRKNHTVYRVVVIDSRAPRDGAYLESVGTYAPLERVEDRALVLKADRIQHWLSLGAQMSENVEHLVKKGAPSVVHTIRERLIARRIKKNSKRKERKIATA